MDRQRTEISQIRRRIARMEAQRERMAGQKVLNEARRGRFLARLDAQIAQAKKSLAAAKRKQGGEVACHG